MTKLAYLPDRGVIRVTGEDRVAFLQGLVSNDVTAVAPGHAVWAAFLTPQGKWLADFFVVADGDTLLLDCERAQVPMLLPRLSRYRLRMKVVLGAEDAMRVHVAWDGTPHADAGIVVPDPRLAGFAWRVLATAVLPATATETDWHRYRLTRGVPDGSRDLESDKTVLLEAGFDELNGISWTKGCYMGQELTARTRYRGLLKRRLVPVSVDGVLPDPGTPVLRNGTEVGTMRSGQDRQGLAVLRLDSLDGPLECGGARLTPRIPDWMDLPEKAKAG
ncbi:YgfZ/GcvT domain-containing protein [Rhodopila sp.]|jgi:folate-binding protein YgfZ|uniref:CAF17-like 4Fe-4S cluster assembly/insertion protein YgfZ n=1 Tax=Rhodopila sp. TaxID=2480087 RepID=UPI002C145B55|nr:folate-binding protein [Rhodopila sp.]HVZ10172.1 folate-binding protein [Rhodopila sp.]